MELSEILKIAEENNNKEKRAFLFPGQGAQYVGMGKEIYNKYLIEDSSILRPKTNTQIRKTIKNAYIAGKYKMCMFWILKYLRMKILKR